MLRNVEWVVDDGVETRGLGLVSIEFYSPGYSCPAVLIDSR